MVFDKCKVFAAMNADEVKVGSKGFFANTIARLKEMISEEGTDQIEGSYIKTLTRVNSESYEKRFVNVTDSANVRFGGDYQFFYLVEEPEEKKSRPYKDGDEFIADFKRRWEKYSGVKFHENAMSQPFIWLKHKVDKWGELVSRIGEDGIIIDNNPYTFDEILDNFVYLDGSPCGIEEETK